MKKVNRLKITHTRVQWGKINDALNQQGIKSISTHITKELVRIEQSVDRMEAISDCSTCGVKEQKIFWLNDSSIKIITRLKDKTGMDAGSIISNFVINPLLLKE